MYSDERSDEIRHPLPPSEHYKAQVDQMPKNTCTFTGGWQLYLGRCDLSVQSGSQPSNETGNADSTKIRHLSGNIQIALTCISYRSISSSQIKNVLVSRDDHLDFKSDQKAFVCEGQCF